MRNLVGHLCLGVLFLSGPSLGWSAESLRQIGVGRADITPAYPIRLSGYAARTRESEGVAQHLWAKALAIGSDKEGPAILITVDNCGVPGQVRNEVAARLLEKRGIENAKVAVCSTHTHSAPMIAGYLSNLFNYPLPVEEVAHIDRYTSELTDALERAALQALDTRAPGTLSRGQGHAPFAANRRKKNGPADQDLPILVVKDRAGKIRAILASYACHCTTLGGEFNQVCGDWAGFAQEEIEKAYPGCTALIALGCGGDANPSPRPGIELARVHGNSIATNVTAIIRGGLRPVSGTLSCLTCQIELPFASVPTRAEWEERAKKSDHYGSQARMVLARLDKGGTIAEKLPYMIQTWVFDQSLAMIFLPGEVVADYSLRLKRELDPRRIWVNAYANDVPCYVPSERVLKEGGYEGGAAMVYYDKPGPFASGIEELILGGVKKLVPPNFEMPVASQNFK